MAHLSVQDWLRGWKEWARTRKRGKLAQFIVDKLEENKQARWLDVSLGKFELTEWNAIAEQWFKERPRISDLVDAPSMLRKGLPRAFPGLEEVKAESIKEGTQHKSKVFQAPQYLMQEVSFHVINKAELHPEPSTHSLQSSMGYLEPADAYSMENPASDSSSSFDNYQRYSIPQPTLWESPVVDPLDMIASDIAAAAGSNQPTPYSTLEHSPYSGFSPHYASSSSFTPVPNPLYSPEPGAEQLFQQQPVDMVSTHSASPLSQRLPEFLPMKTFPNRSPVEGGGQLCLLFYADLPPGDKWVSFVSQQMAEFTTTVEAYQFNKCSLVTTIPKHAVPETVLLQVICNSQVLTQTEFTFFTPATSQFPQIIEEPNSLENAVPGEPAEFVVKAVGEDLTYTWHRQDTEQTLPIDKKVIVGNTQILHIDKVEPSNEGYYVCTISNPTGGSVETNPVQLTTRVQSFQSQYGCNTDGSSMCRGHPSPYPQASNPFPSMGSGGGVMTPVKVEKPHQLVKSEGETTDDVKGGVMTPVKVEKPHQLVKSEGETTDDVKGGVKTFMEVDKPRQQVKSKGETTENVKCSEYLRGVEVLAETRFILKGTHSQTLKWEGHGLKLSIPEGAVLSESVISIKAGLAGQFELPSRAQLVSPVYWLYCNTRFQHPVTLELQHCATIKHEPEMSSLCFIVAKCSQELPYKFKFLNKGTFSQSSSYGSVDVKQFSLFGIVIKWGMSLFLHSPSPQYYCAQLFYTDEGVNAWKLDFIITWNLDIYLTHIKQKYSNLAIEGPHTEVQFERDSISLAIPESGIIENGWAITPLTPTVITKEQVDRFQPGKRIPTCQLQIQLLVTDSPETLYYRLALEGAKEPFNFLKVNRIPVHGRKRPQQSDGDQINVYDGPARMRPRQYEGIQSNDERPEMHELQLIKWYKGDQEKHLKIKASIATHWRQLGTTLGISPAELEGFNQQYMLNQEDCCQAVLLKWMQNGSQPRDAYAVTWRGLMEALRDTSLREIASDLETALRCRIPRPII